MLKVIFTLLCGFMLGALAIEYKQHYSNVVAIPVAMLPDGGQYDGELLKGEPNDRGRIVWPNGDYYDGEFRNGFFHGLGRYKTADQFYEGEFVNGVAEGEGSIEFADGRYFSGEVKRGKPQGYGVMTLADGEYTGEFNNGLFNGEGVLQFSNGNFYEGEFSQGDYNGQGTFTTVDQKIFKGQFENGAMNGQGDYRDDEVAYTGSFSNWLFSGEGQFESEDIEYKGQFSNNKFHGVGEYSDSAGRYYRGSFENGVFHGQGILEVDGDRYEGGFEYGLKHGDGALKYAKPVDGIAQIKGQWYYGELLSSDNPLVEHDGAKIAEYALFNQEAMLNQLIDSINENDPDQIDMYFVGIGGDGEEGVFRREAISIREQFDVEFGTQGKSALLVNSQVSWKDIPLATPSSIEKLLAGVAEKMDAEQDILFLYLTSHGSPEFEFQLTQPGITLNPLSAEKLATMVNSLPVKHKVVVISACYSGGYVIPLKSPTTMIITAAAEDKSSFGCSDTRDMTYFGEAFFKDALPLSQSFEEAFDRSREIIRGREAKEGYDYSNPLIFKPAAALEQLSLWREDLAQWKKDKRREIIADE